MNPRAWEIWYVGDNPGTFIPGTNDQCTEREVTIDQIERVEADK